MMPVESETISNNGDLVVKAGTKPVNKDYQTQTFQFLTDKVTFSKSYYKNVSLRVLIIY